MAQNNKTNGLPSWLLVSVQLSPSLCQHLLNEPVDGNFFWRVYLHLQNKILFKKLHLRERKLNVRQKKKTKKDRNNNKRKHSRLFKNPHLFIQ